MEEPAYPQTKSIAAMAARRNGHTAFETKRISTDPERWIFESRTRGPGIEFAELWSADKDYIHHVEITEHAIPILVVTCKREEITDDIPELFRIEPVTPSLFDIERAPRVKRERPAPEDDRTPAQLHSNVDPAELARAMLILESLKTAPPPVENPSPPRAPTPAELAAKLFS